MKLIIMLETKITQANDNGKNIFQPNRINWSYLYLGKVTRTQTKVNKKNNSFIINQKIPGIKYKNCRFTIGNHPPKNKTVSKAHINIMLIFSPKKNCANVIAEYSTK